MIKIIFITILFLSSNVFATTYLVCPSHDTTISIKLGNKKISIKRNTNEYENYTKFITSWNNEIIKIETPSKFVSKYTEKEKNKSTNDLSENMKKLMQNTVVYIDRVTGNLSWNGRNFQCEVREKTLF
jgi:hypothetical protein